MHDLLQEARGQLDDVVRLRRSIHREAELGLGDASEWRGRSDAANAHSNRYLLEEEATVTGQAMYAAGALDFLRSA